MKLFVFFIEELIKPLSTLLQINVNVYRVKTLLGGGHSLWEDDDPAIEDTEQSIIKNYLEKLEIIVKEVKIKQIQLMILLKSMILKN
jgi:hypothetical protein